MNKIISRLQNLITLAKKTSVTEHDNNIPVAQAAWLSKVGKVAVIYPYGSMGSAPVGAVLLKMNVQSNEENAAAIEFAPDILDKELKAGEYTCGNFVIGSVIKFDEDGNINITSSAKVNIESADEVNIGESVNLGTGGQPIARAGDAVQVVITSGSSAGTWNGTITSGSSNHTAD